VIQKVYCWFLLVWIYPSTIGMIFYCWIINVIFYGQIAITFHSTKDEYHIVFIILLSLSNLIFHLVYVWEFHVLFVISFMTCMKLSLNDNFHWIGKFIINKFNINYDMLKFQWQWFTNFNLGRSTLSSISYKSPFKQFPN